jgi:hypothetical protein
LLSSPPDQGFCFPFSEKQLPVGFLRGPPQQAKNRACRGTPGSEARKTAQAASFQRSSRQDLAFWNANMMMHDVREEWSDLISDRSWGRYGLPSRTLIQGFTPKDSRCYPQHTAGDGCATQVSCSYVSLSPHDFFRRLSRHALIQSHTQQFFTGCDVPVLSGDAGVLQ